MSTNIYQVASTLIGLEKQQTAVANNIAASTKNGYKKDLLAFSNLHTGHTQHARPYRFVNASASTDLSQGQVRRTENPYDMALSGNAFFTVRSNDGATQFTRNGAFRLNSSSQLVTASGSLVIGKGGPIQIDPNLGPIRVATDGRILQGETEAGQLALADISDPALVARSSEGFTPLDPGYNPPPTSNPVVQHGFLESSNVSAVAEMVKMIETSRAYEINQKLIQQEEALADKTINKLSANT